jgi:uncharacterized protein YlxW (UPF0749 family)
MTDNLGELKTVKILLAIVIGIAFAWFTYSRFSFRQEPAADDKSEVLERELKQTNDDAASLRQRVDDIERRLAALIAEPRVRTSKRGKRK